MYTVKDLAEIAGITVRTLHHYDKIDLLKPAGKTEAGYRLYGKEQLERLHEVLFFRELKFSLDEIKHILSQPSYDRKLALKTHRNLMEKEKDRLEALIKTLDACIDETKGEYDMEKTKESLKALDKSTLEAYRKEAVARWGSDMVETSEERMKQNGMKTPEAAQKEMDALLCEAASIQTEPVESETVQTFVEKYRAHINRFYDCTDDIFLGLAQMYLEDPRFYENMSAYGKGLPEFLSAAMRYSVVTQPR